jgi:hypothetical protein
MGIRLWRKRCGSNGQRRPHPGSSHVRQPQAQMGRLQNGSLAECRDAGLACQQECCLSGTRRPSAASWDTTVFRLHLAGSQTARRLWPERRGRRRAGDCLYMTRSSSGWRNTSSTWWRNSGSSSRNKMPLWASDTSPGIGTWPPPISPTSEMVWCRSLPPGAGGDRGPGPFAGTRLTRRPLALSAPRPCCRAPSRRCR